MHPASLVQHLVLSDLRGSGPARATLSGKFALAADLSDRLHHVRDRLVLHLVICFISVLNLSFLV